MDCLSKKKKLEMREVNGKGNSLIFLFRALFFYCNVCDANGKLNVFIEDCVARFLSVNCNKSKLNIVSAFICKFLRLSYTCSP